MDAASEAFSNEMKDCPCGKPVRLGAFRITVNRKRGIAHYIEHMDGSRCENTKKWTCSMMNPYLKEPNRPMDLLIASWNERSAP